ncbi:MAG: SGNH/GDSL hydrolase family protein [Geodermatophilaceae bacterium]|nr:SGNH/GDSL hydrolase family protein [Geodermatophilaceae bacterium]
MGMNGTVRRVALGTMITVGGMGAAAGGLMGLIMSQSRSARRVVEERSPIFGPPTADGMYGSFPGTPINVALLGDSSAVGLGVDSANETPGVLIVSALSDLALRPVHFTRLAWIGAQSCDLGAQVRMALDETPDLDLAIIMIGANDVTSRTRPSVSVRFLSEAVAKLRDAGSEVVVATCPDLGTIRPIRQPLRFIARRWSRELAALQTVAVVKAGGRTVSLGAILGPAFARDPRMFSVDEFHPSAEGYAAAAAVLLPTAAAALGLWPETGEPRDRAFGKERVTSVEHAALRAAERAGTEVSQADADAPVSSGWARLRRRRPLTMVEAEDYVRTGTPEQAKI